MYRLQKRDAISTGLHWQIHKDAAADWRDGAGRMEVAVSIGSDPSRPTPARALRPGTSTS